jgi:hypothetical protein
MGIAADEEIMAGIHDDANPEPVDHRRRDRFAGRGESVPAKSDTSNTRPQCRAGTTQEIAPFQESGHVSFPFRDPSGRTAASM